MLADTIIPQTDLDTAVNHLLWAQAAAQRHIEVCSTQASCQRCPLQHGCQL